MSTEAPLAPAGPETPGPVTGYVEATATAESREPAPTASGPPDPPTRLGRVSTALTVIGLGLIAFAVFAIWGTAVLQQRDQNELRSDLAERFVVDRATAESGGAGEGVAAESGFGTAPEESEGGDTGNAPEELGPVGTGDAMALLRIPALGLDQVVVEGSGAQQLRSAPGHLRGTPRPGQKGNVVIVGKRTTYGGPFGDIDELEKGNRIEVGTAAGTYRYIVEKVATLVPEEDEDVIGGTEGNQLTLISADPPYRAVERLVVIARLDSDEDGAPLRTVPAGLEPGADELGIGRDANATSSVLLFALVFVLSAIGFAWVRPRWTRWALWAVFVPVWAAVGVMLFENLLRWFPATV